MTPSNFPDDEIISEINLTPLVDVSLVLVIIFMVVAPFFSHILKPLLLPPAGKAALNDQNTIKVSIFPDGTLAVGSSMVSESELGNRIKKEIQEGKQPWVLVRAGEEVVHGRVMEILKVIKTLGVQRIAFATRPKVDVEGGHGGKP
ncbi:MAG: biopolymer transporter ExbD [Elusimicrobia bacterium]|nr:biopolymer transporter ExbD [Elusimicrobiota bacterium]